MNAFAHPLSRMSLNWLQVVVQLLVVLVVTLPAVQWLSTSQSIWIVPFKDLPPGQLAYLLSKLAALYAISIFGLQLAYGLAGARARVSLNNERGARFHRATGLITLGLLLTHAALFIGGASLRIGHFASQFVLLSLFSDYYVSRIALGWWAALVLVFAAACALFRTRLARLWRYAHWLSIPAAVAALIHSLAIGTESRMPAMMLAYGCMAALLSIAVFSRFRSAAKPAQA